MDEWGPVGKSVGRSVPFIASQFIYEYFSRRFPIFDLVLNHFRRNRIESEVRIIIFNRQSGRLAPTIITTFIPLPRKPSNGIKMR